MTEKDILALRYFVNKKGQVEGIELVKDSENPDGVLSVKQLKEVSPKPPGSRRPFGSTKRLPDKQVPVRLQPTGNIMEEEASLETTNTVIDLWDDYGPLKKN